MLQVFYGRSAELVQLRKWVLEQQCRLVALLGIGGIGKRYAFSSVSEESAFAAFGLELRLASNRLDINVKLKQGG
ncbi:hypothetical protein [Scytonema sp. UIC 10036]|uniref:hypothetical protein n=1 Tax=Scytonema sp. UIC 10036 TaxID=2304196 RepID=UPI001A9A8903|nr:hypothetical protein [Scytonema sp. UIC 10036]